MVPLVLPAYVRLPGCFPNFFFFCSNLYSLQLYSFYKLIHSVVQSCHLYYFLIPVTKVTKATWQRIVFYFYWLAVWVQWDKGRTARTWGACSHWVCGQEGAERWVLDGRSLTSTLLFIQDPPHVLTLFSARASAELAHVQRVFQTQPRWQHIPPPCVLFFLFSSVSWV